MKIKMLLAASIMSLMTVSYAHSDMSKVKNEAVKARMEAMSSIGAQMKTLGGMAKGEMDFDADKANDAVKTIAMIAATVPALFEAEEDDPESEAKAEIWFDFEDFTQKSVDLEMKATEIAGSIQAKSDIGAAMGQLGGTCKACHQSYKE